MENSKSEESTIIKTRSQLLKQDLKELKKISNGLKPQFNLGKSGLSETFVKTVEDYLVAHTIVKIKVSVAENKTASNVFADLLSKELDATIIEKKGFTFTIYRR